MHQNRRVFPSQCFSCLSIITDQKEGSLICASFSSWFWFRTRDGCLVSMNTTAWEKTQQELLDDLCLSLQGIALLLGRHLEGAGVRGQVRANERPRRAASQGSGRQTHCSVSFCLSFSQKLAPLQVCCVSPVFLYLFLIGDEERAEPHIKQVYFRQFLPVSPKVRLSSKNVMLYIKI